MTVSPLSQVGASSAVVGQPAETKDAEALKKAAKAFEAVFVRQIMSEMRASSFGDDLTGSSSVEQFQEMADAKTADNLADKGSFGIADLLVKQLSPRQAHAAYVAQSAPTASKD